MLLQVDGVSVGDYRCNGVDSRGDEKAHQAEIVFVRSGAFRIESERGRALADPSRAIVLRSGECFQVTHPGPCADRSLVIGLSSETIRELGTMRKTNDGGEESPLPVTLTVRCSRSVYLEQRKLAAALERGTDPLGANEVALTLAEKVLAPHEAVHDRCVEEDDRVEAVKALLAERFTEPCSLAEIGAAVDLSQYRIARLFRASTGSTIHDHRIELRLRAAVERLADGEEDLTELALDLGFFDHSHFTRSFRRRFGLPPSRYRAQVIASA
jgi:AraC family transcriptional regulator